LYNIIVSEIAFHQREYSRSNQNVFSEAFVIWPVYSNEYSGS